MTRRIAGTEVRTFKVKRADGRIVYRTLRQLRAPCRCNLAECSECHAQYQNAALKRQGL